MNNDLIGTAYKSDVGAEVVYGTVRISGNKSMSIAVDSTLLLHPSQLIIPKHLEATENNFTIDGVAYSFLTESPFCDGAKVILLREGGGQRYAVIGVIG